MVTGIRRCGKSYLLNVLFYHYLLENGVADDHIIRVDLEDRINKDLRNPDAMLHYVRDRIKDKELYYIIIDEVQLMDEFVDVLNSFRHIDNADTYVTGSNSHFLSSDIPTEFRGRGETIHVNPLSFSEFYSAKGGDKQDAWREFLNKAIRYDIKGKKYINTLSKYYFADIGLRNAVLDMRQQEETHIMENIIYNELIVRGYSVDVGMVEIKRADKDGKWSRIQLEVDFIAGLGSKKYYIQSALSVPDRDKEMQESRSLININDSFRKIIVVKDHIMPRRNEEGILTVGLFDFLLNEDSLDMCESGRN